MGDVTAGTPNKERIGAQRIILIKRYDHPHCYLRPRRPWRRSSPLPVGLVCLGGRRPADLGMPLGALAVGGGARGSPALAR